MGEIFAYDRLYDPPMDLVPISDKEKDSYLLHPGDLLFARQSLVREGAGKCSIVKQIGSETTFESHLIRCRLNLEFANPDFYYYFFKSHLGKAAIEAIIEQVAAAGIRGTDLAKVLLPVPPIYEQQAIAHILVALDDKIELNKRMNETLESMAQGLFKSWFVDFDPVIDNVLVTGKPIPPELTSRGALREALGNKGKILTEKVRNLFPSKLNTCEYGWTPDGWKMYTIGDVVKVVGGGTPSTAIPDYWEGGVHPFCTPKDMSGLLSTALVDTERYLTDKGVAKVSSGILPPGTVLLSSRAPIGYLAISDIPISVNQGIIAMICDNLITNAYVLNWTRFHMEDVLARANGATFLEISKKNFRTIPFLHPNEEVLKAFNAFGNEIYSRIRLCAREMYNLAKLRDHLLSKLLSGSLRVKDAEKIVESHL